MQGSLARRKSKNDDCCVTAMEETPFLTGSRKSNGNHGKCATFVNVSKTYRFRVIAEWEDIPKRANYERYISADQQATYSMPMTPQATRSPEFPVFEDRALSPLPRSSSPEWMTMLRPRMLCIPPSEMKLSVMFTTASPASLAWTFPRSPMCLLLSSGEP